MPNLVEIENLHVKFNTDSGEVNAVNGISFDIFVEDFEVI